MAALICALRERLKGELDFRFGILCSGYALPSTEFLPGSINCPSLHIFGSDLGKDRQIANQASREWHGSGSGSKVLTGSMPKEIKHIESLLNNFSHGMGMESCSNMKAATN
ncbi:hypothetical protein LWI29_029717 [Acer saccharum]|uniref:Serine hydrolase domain-containing protein n=1 Tax=Acer saccharum TaxID=4024 RepID=A0AA39SZS1_ACESA|nr:hypothetical protein LWI29_029717 [Acer saccharum]